MPAESQLDDQSNGMETGRINPTSELLSLRDKIDAVDNLLLPLISRRLELVRAVGDVKKRENLPIRDRVRERQKLEALTRRGEEMGVEGQEVEQIWSIFFEIAYRLEE